MVPIKELCKSQTDQKSIAMEAKEAIPKWEKKHEQGSSGRNKIDLNEREKEVLEKLEASKGPEEKAKAVKIQMVPRILRQEDLKEYYTPREMFLGPLNYDAKRFPEDMKIKLTTKFLRETGQDRDALYKKIKTDIADLKESFLDNLDKLRDEANLDDHEKLCEEKLALILFFDGCSILQFIYSYVFDSFECLEINQRKAAVIQQDIFLLENQLPFKLLNLIMKEASNRNDLKEAISDFIHLNIMAPVYYSTNLNNINFLTAKPAHLLELLHMTLVQPIATDKKLEEKSSDHSSYKRTFRNIQDLKSTWIRLKPSESCSLRDVTFSASHGFFQACLNLPPLIVDNSTLRKLFNLVAFEMCPEKFQAGHGVTSYLYFLDSLIDTEDDAKELRTAEIFRNRLSSDAEVSKFFNEMGRHLLPAPAYVGVKMGIQRHYDSRWMRWVAQVHRDHFRTPWTFLGLVAALAMLVMTGIQTWFDIYPHK